MWARAFSVRDNLASLGRRPGAVAPVDGLRALSILWVVGYHAFAFVGRPLRHGEYEPLFRVINRGLLGVDVFFVISGFLIGSMLLREQDARGGIAFGRFYARRALRILPAYWLALAVHVAVDGKNAENAWANIVFVNNFLPESGQCMPWTWSLAIEEQFYLVFPLCLAAIGRVPRARLSILVALLGLAVVVRAVIVARHGLHLPSVEHGREYYDTLYDKPQARFGELVAGVVLAELALRPHVLAAVARARVASTAGTALAIAIVATMALVGQPVSQYGAAFAFAYFAVGHLLFAISIAYLLLVCLTGAGGGRLLGKLLSWRVLLPIGQLSYATYLVHMIAITAGLKSGLLDEAHSPLAMIGALAVVTALSLLAALPLYLLVEKPFMNLRRGSARP